MRAIVQVIAGIVLLSCCCGNGEPEELTGAEAVAEPDTVFITAVDTIGTEMGEGDDVFAFIVDASYTPSGTVAVLDAGKIALKVFRRDGTLFTQVGRQGQGPGEYQMPLGLAILANEFVVSDLSGAKIIRYDAMGTHTGEITGFFPVPPTRIRGTSDNRFLASDVFLDMEGEGGPSASMDFVAFGDSTAPITVFKQYPIDMTGGMVQATVNLEFCGGPGNLSYLAEISDSLFLVSVYDLEGTETLRLTEEFDRIPLTEEELAEEQLSISLSIVNGETSLSTDRTPVTATHRNIIEGIGVDAEGRIWVRMGNTGTTWFRVFSPEGDLIYIAIPDSTVPDDAEYSISTNGMLAYDTDPEDWPKVYLLESDIPTETETSEEVE